MQKNNLFVFNPRQGTSNFNQIFLRLTCNLYCAHAPDFKFLNNPQTFLTIHKLVCERLEQRILCQQKVEISNLSLLEHLK